MTVDKKSVQYRIWHNTYLCQMRNIDTMSVDYLKIFGTLDSGDSSLNNDMMNEMVLRRLTIIEMVKFFHQGVTVAIKNPADCKSIYILIQEHLQNWAREIKYSLRQDTIPTEELDIMERFADVVYEHAKWYLDDALVDTPFARSLKHDDRSVLSLLKMPEKEEDPDGIIVHPKRQSLADVFNQGVVKMEKKY